MKAPHRMPRHYYRNRRRTHRSDLAAVLSALGIVGIVMAVALLSCWAELARVIAP